MSDGSASTSTSVDRALVRELKNREDERFLAEHPRSAALREQALEVMPNGVPMAWLRGSYHHVPPWVAEGNGARFTDVDGHTYSDFNIADMLCYPLLTQVRVGAHEWVRRTDRGSHGVHRQEGREAPARPLA